MTDRRRLVLPPVPGGQVPFLLVAAALSHAACAQGGFSGRQPAPTRRDPAAPPQVVVDVDVPRPPTTPSPAASVAPTVAVSPGATPSAAPIASPAAAKCASDVTGLRRIRYKDPKVAYGAFCQSESQTATCVLDAAGKDAVTWTGMYQHSDCVSEGGVACSGGIRHGESQTRVRFKASEVAFGQECESQRAERVCSNGSYSGWIPNDTSHSFESCAVRAPRSCTWDGRAFAHRAGLIVTKYRDAQVEPGQSCAAETKALVCHDGAVIDRSTNVAPVFSYTQAACQVRALRGCTGEGGAALPSGGTETVWFYNVPSETPSSPSVKCELSSATRTCADGTLSGWSRPPSGLSTCQPLRSIAVKVRAEQISAQLLNCMAVSANGGDWVNLPCSSNTTGTPKVIESSAALPLWESQGNGTPLNHVCIRAWTESGGTVGETRKVRVDGSGTAALTFNHEDKENGDNDYDDYIVRIDTLGRTYLRNAGYGEECRAAVRSQLGR